MVTTTTPTPVVVSVPVLTKRPQSAQSGGCQYILLNRCIVDGKFKIPCRLRGWFARCTSRYFERLQVEHTWYTYWKSPLTLANQVLGMLDGCHNGLGYCCKSGVLRMITAYIYHQIDGVREYFVTGQHNSLIDSKIWPMSTEESSICI